MNYFNRMLLMISFLVGFNYTYSQTPYHNSKFGYSFTIPEGWKVKDEQTSYDNDLKLVNGKGSSVVINVDKLTPDINNRTAKDIYDQFTDSQLLEMYRAMIPSIKLINRGSVDYNGIEFYYINLEIPQGTAPHMLSKIFVVHSEGKRYVFTFNCLYDLESSNLIQFHTVLNSIKL